MLILTDKDDDVADNDAGDVDADLLVSFLLIKIIFFIYLCL